MSKLWTYFLLFFLSAWLLARYVVLPLIARSLGNVRAARISPFSARGIEWRGKDRANAIVPTFRLEKVGWRWGGMSSDEVGLLVLRLEGISLRIKDRRRGMQEAKPIRKKPKAPPGNFAVIKSRLGSYLLHICIHHYPVVARFISIQISDIRLILDDLDGLEITVGDVQLAMAVIFEGNSEAILHGEDLTASPPSTATSSMPQSPLRDFKRKHPFMASPPSSPGIYSTFSNPFSPGGTLDPTQIPCDERQANRLSRLSQARRKATVQYTKMSSSVATLWTRAIGRAYGSVSFVGVVQDLAVILPHESAPPPSARPSIHDLNSEYKGSNVGTTTPKKRDSQTPARSSMSNMRHPSFPSQPQTPPPQPKSPFKSLFKLSDRSAKYLDLNQAGYDTLLSISGRTSAKVSLGFGPRKGLLGEDTLSIEGEIGNIMLTVEAVEQLRDLMKRRKERAVSDRDPFRTEEEISAKKKPAWRPDSMPRIILRAFESVQLSLPRISVILDVAKAPTSQATSHSDLQMFREESTEFYALSLDLEGFAIGLTAADASNNQRSKNAFGTNNRSSSRVRGVGYTLAWTNAAIHCISPGETEDDKSQLFAVRQGNIEGLTTWRPNGWNREELLFPHDPNIALIVMTISVASVDIAADLQLLNELKSAFAARNTKRRRASSSGSSITDESKSEYPQESKPSVLAPRIRMVLDIGSTMVVLADKIANQRATASLAYEGLHFGCFTSYEDTIGRRRDFTSHKKAFEEERALLDRREAAGQEYDGAQTPAVLRPQFRRAFKAEPAALQDDLSIRMVFNANFEMEPISLHLSLSDNESRNPRTFELAEIGRLHGKVDGTISGRTETLSTGQDVHRLDKATMSCTMDLGVAEGIKANLSQLPVIEAIAAMGSRQHENVQPDASPSMTPNEFKKSLLDKIPSGVSARLSLGLISVFVGHPDPNTNCELKLTRGIWLQTSAVLEYSYYTNRIQCMRDRVNAPNTAQRNSLKLPEDIATQAVAFFNELRRTGGKAALSAYTITDFYVMPIYNGDKFYKMGGIHQKHVIDGVPKPKAYTKHTGWNFTVPDATNERAATGRFSNNISPLDLSEQCQASRPLLRVAEVKLNMLIQLDKQDGDTSVKVTGRTKRPLVLADMSHLYSVLLMNMAIHKVSTAWKSPHPKKRKPSKDQQNLSLKIHIPAFIFHMKFPLQEELIVNIGATDISKLPTSGIMVTSEKVMGYVASATDVGVWEELARIKDLKVITSKDENGKPVFDINPEFFKITIPSHYNLSMLILNINVSIKSIKRLMENLKTGHFDLVHKPGPEDAKRIPKIRISFKRLSLEAEDDQLETRLNLIFRAGLIEQQRRLSLEDSFNAKLNLMGSPEGASSEESMGDAKHSPKLTRNATVDHDEARVRLDWFMAREWTRRIRLAKAERRRRESEKNRCYRIPDPEPIPIRIAQHDPTAPLFRAQFEDVKWEFSGLDWSMEEIIKYMGDNSAPFDEGVEFSLMLPMMFKWTMAYALVTLRDYPLPMICVQRSGDPASPAWNMETPFIIAEEMHGPETWFSIPTEILPAGVGDKDAAPLRLEINKTVTPVKTYTRPVIHIKSSKVTEFTWGNSYQPCIQDVMKIIDTFSRPPKDPSDKPGFWDKFRLNLHWRVQIDFDGPVHLHMKGAYDPYAIRGHGAGFALAWRHGTRFRIGYSNLQYETIQIEASELMVAIPDLSALQDGAAIGNEYNEHDGSHLDESDHTESSLINRRYTKPCAVFNGGVRVGFGFVFERTCRPWSCDKGCGHTEKLARRRCRFFTFKKHQEVLLRNPQAVEEEAMRLGHPSDSFECFRSDFVHFSVSLVMTKSEGSGDGISMEQVTEPSSLHFTPKAFAHFYAWWALFNGSLSLPIRQGKLFPNAGPPSKKFGRSLGTIKYRFDLSDVFLSHVYLQVTPELWKVGKTQALGIKTRFGRLRADLHQRRQERIVKHEKLERTQILPHKPFYAVDVLLDDIEPKGLVAEFVSEQLSELDGHEVHGEFTDLKKASQLPKEKKVWYNFFDFIDSDRRPHDHDPMIQFVDLGECPQLFLSRRVKAMLSDPLAQDEIVLAGRFDLETSKFGHEKSHICYLGEAPGVGPTQVKLVERRIKELEWDLEEVKAKPEEKHKLSLKEILSRLRDLRQHAEDLTVKEKRHMLAETLVTPDELKTEATEEFFNNEFHVHNPKIFLTNTSRNVLYRYWYSSQDRKKEEYTTSHAALRSVRDGVARRMNRQTGPDLHAMHNQDAAMTLLQELRRLLLQNTQNRLFRLPADIESTHGIARLAAMGISLESMLKAKSNILLLKPQIALKSEIDENSLVLLAVEEITFRLYGVTDQKAEDHVSADIMSRNFMFLKGLQGFYPTEAIMRKARDEVTGVPRGLDFLPLEIFLDVKSEATDYDRIVLKTDAGLHIDKFNHLRQPRGIIWPDTEDDFGMPIEHLRLHQDMTNIIVPRLTVSATSKHYTALYNVVTDLLLYQDPRHRHRSERIEQFILGLDRKERDPSQLILDIFKLQQSIKGLNHIHLGYEANADLLTDLGKQELFKIRTDLLEMTEQLFTVFQAVAVVAKKDDARADLVQSSKINVQAGGIAWHMLRNDFSPLVKLDIDGTLFSYITNKDGSTDNALLLSDLSALNSNADAVFQEVMTRMDSSSSRKADKSPFAWAAWAIMAPVGGIPIVKDSKFYLHNVTICLEEKVAHNIMDYVFADRAKRREEGKKTKKEDKKGKENLLPKIEINGKGDLSRSNSHNFSPLTRSQSSTSVATQATTSSTGTRAVSASFAMTAERAKGDEKFTMVPSKDAKEMRQRANKTRVFNLIEVMETAISLSYKTDDSKKHSGFTLPDCVDFKLKLPKLTYANKVWGYEDIIEAVKRDYRSFAWSQRGMLVSQVFKNTSLFRTKKALKALSGQFQDHPTLPHHLSAAPSSKLRYTVEAATPEEDENDEAKVPDNPIVKVISRLSMKNGEATSPRQHIPRIASFGKEAAFALRGGSSSQGNSPVKADPHDADGEDEEILASEYHRDSNIRRSRSSEGQYRDSESEEEHENANGYSLHEDHSDSNVGKAMKGFLGRLGGRKRDKSSSTDDLRALSKSRSSTSSPQASSATFKSNKTSSSSGNNSAVQSRFYEM